MIASGLAPRTLNRRVSSVSSFVKCMQGVAAELRLPITVPNPTHGQFISRASTDAVKETRDLSKTRVRQLMGLPKGESPAAYRDRAISIWFIYSGVRLATAWQLSVSDFKIDDEYAVMRITEKGDKHRTIGLHFAAAEAIAECLHVADINRGPLFLPLTSSNSNTFGNKRISEIGMHAIATRT